MEGRYLSKVIDEMSFKYGKMAFVSGPRQVGKTTMAKALLSDRHNGQYCNWDDKDFRKTWVKGPKQIVSPLLKDVGIKSKTQLLILDELHKDTKWKSSLKGLFDLFHDQIDILVTGSARLNIFKKGGDSLLGRYFSFRLHPLSIAEVTGRATVDPMTLVDRLFNSAPKKAHKRR